MNGSHSGEDREGTGSRAGPSKGLVELETLISEARRLTSTHVVEGKRIETMLRSAGRVHEGMGSAKEYERSVNNMLAATGKMERRKALLDDLQRENRMIKSYEEENRMLRDQLEKSYATLDEMIARHRKIMQKVKQDAPLSHVTPDALAAVLSAPFSCNVEERELQKERAMRLMEILRYCEQVEQRDTALAARIVRENRVLRELLNLASMSDTSILPQFRGRMREAEMDWAESAGGISDGFDSGPEVVEEANGGDDNSEAEEAESEQTALNSTVLHAGTATATATATVKESGEGGQFLSALLSVIPQCDVSRPLDSDDDDEDGVNSVVTVRERNGDHGVVRDLMKLHQGDDPDSGTSSSLSSSPASSESSKEDDERMVVSKDAEATLKGGEMKEGRGTAITPSKAKEFVENGTKHNGGPQSADSEV